MYVYMCKRGLFFFLSTAFHPLTPLLAILFILVHHQYTTILFTHIVWVSNSQNIIDYLLRCYAYCLAYIYFGYK